MPINLYYIDHLKSLFLRIIDGVGRSPIVPGLIADTYTAVFHQMAVASEHTVLGVLLGGVDYLIRLGLYALVFLHVPGGPSPWAVRGGR